MGKFLGVFVTICAALALAASVVVAEELTPQLCKDKVLAAAQLVEAEGASAIAKIKDENGEFRFAGGEGYIWIHDLDLKMIMHPVKPSLDGTSIADMRDTNGVYLFIAMNEIVEEHGQGWVPYAWPKPGQEGSSPKVSFVKLVSKDGVDYVLGAGMYDVTAEQIKAQYPDDAVYEQ